MGIVLWCGLVAIAMYVFAVRVLGDTISDSALCELQMKMALHDALRRVENDTVAAMAAAQTGRNPTIEPNVGPVKCSYCSCMNEKVSNCQSCGGPLDWHPKVHLRPARPVWVHE